MSEWATATVGELADLVRGVTYKKTDARSTPRAGYLPLVRATNIGPALDLAGEMVYVPETVVKPVQLLQSGDIVLASSSGSLSVVGKSARLEQPWTGTFGAFCAVLRPHEEVDARFLALYVSSESVRRRWSDAARGTNINNLKPGDVQATPVPLPPLDEQHRIVDILEDHLSRLDAAASYCDGARRRLTALDRSILRDAWESASATGVSTPIDGLCDTALGKMLDAKRTTGEPTAYLGNINVRWGAFDLADLSTVPLTADERERFALRAGDILVCEGGEPGRCAVWRGQRDGLAFQKALHRLRVRDSSAAEPHFISLMLEAVVRSPEGGRHLTGTTITHLPQERLRALKIPLPSLARQHEISEEVAERRESLSRAESAIDVTHARTAALRRGLLAAAFSGQLVGAAR